MWEISVKGVVQGVGFRPTVLRCAMEIGANGWVMNQGSHVAIYTDYDPEEFVDELRKRLGPIARIESYVIEEKDEKGYGIPKKGFRILESSEGDLDSSLPPDTAICEKCLSEMTDPTDRRYRHPFTNCTNCGARYSVMDGLPYDRERTTMDSFPPCEICSKEYNDPLRRRFHAQTLSCPRDGPTYRFLDSDLREISSGYNAIRKMAYLIQKGKWGVVKGWGGMHIACGPDNIDSMREWYGRPFKPFALMCKDIESVKRIAKLTDEMESSLMSSARPILLLDKREDVGDEDRMLQESASPGLPTLGLFLPYSGVHHLLFGALEEIGCGYDALLMTSANMPDEPMALDIGAVSDLGAPGYLVHNRRISARIDDSVVVPSRWIGEDIVRSPGPFGVEGFPIRKARGLIPDPIDAGHDKKILALGAERNVTVSLSRSGRIFTSPYLGNARNPSVADHIGGTVNRMDRLFGGLPPDAVVVDTHPRYATRPIGKEMRDRFGCELIDVQHHHAHAVSLMNDAGLERLACLAFDGVGFGDDGTPWGGECIIADKGSYDRINHLEPFGLPGGDSSVYHPERIAYWLSVESGFDLDISAPGTSALLDKTHDRSVMTTSMGRLLDALSALMLGITWRSYDGEPAMRMEALLKISRSPATDLFQGVSSHRPVAVRERWGILMDELFGGSDGILDPDIDRNLKADLSLGMAEAILEDMVDSAVQGLEKEGWDPIVGITGGVAYNTILTNSFVKICRDRGIRPVLHSRVPPGDGGVSVGQAAAGGHIITDR